MKWALVVYFMTTAGWQSAESVGMDKLGWSSIVYETYQECSFRATKFNEDPEYRDKINYLIYGTLITVFTRHSKSVKA